MAYASEAVTVPKLDILTFLFDSEYTRSKEETPLHAEARNPDHVITKAQVRDLTKRFAYVFRHEFGIGASESGKDVVVCFSLGQSALASLFYGVIAAGGVYSPASPSATPAELARQIQDGAAKVLACSKELEPVALRAAQQAGLPRECVVVLESYPKVVLSVAQSSQICNLARSLDWDTITDSEIVSHRTTCLVYSSGTTGLPKGVRLSHLNLVAQVFLVSFLNRPVFDKWAQEGWKSRTLGHLPAAHIAGLQSYLIAPIFEGHMVFWMPSFNFEDFVKYCISLKITALMSVPPIWMAIAKHPAITTQLRGIRGAVTGAAPLSAELQAAVQDKIGGPLRQTWGLTENCGAASFVAPDRTDTLGSLGPLLPGIQMRLVDDEGKDVPHGEPGEALLKGPIVAIGYHNNEQANKDAFTSDGWLRTGDVLRMENNLLYVVDRKKEMIKYKGLQVAPVELEAVLTSHPGVSDAAVVGTWADETEVPRAFVVRAPGAQETVSEASLASFVRERVAPYKQLRGGVEFVDSIPRSPSGKILRRRLRDSLAARAKL